jgi:hypothetical protein
MPDPVPYGTSSYVFGEIKHAPSHFFYGIPIDYSSPGNPFDDLPRTIGQYDLGVTLTTIYGSAFVVAHCPVPGN